MDTKERTRTSGQKKRSASAAVSRRRTSAAGSARAVKPSGAAGTRSARVKAAGAVKNRSRRNAVKQPTPDVVYTQPAAFNKYRFLLHLATVVAVVLALLFGMSIFFKVKVVTVKNVAVTGNAKYTAWDVREASGILEGENLLTISEAKISNNIKTALPYVDHIRVGIKLPDTVKIEIVELDVVYAIEADDGAWWLIRSDGGVVEKTNNADAQQHTVILGVKITQPAVGEQAVALQPQQSTEEGETIPVTVLASQQLQTAIDIAQYMEDSGVIGEAASIDVTDLGNLELWYADRYQVTLGDAMELGYKIRSMKSAIDQMGDYQSGILDVSFTTWPEEVGYTPFP